MHRRARSPTPNAWMRYASSEPSSSRRPPTRASASSWPGSSSSFQLAFAQHAFKPRVAILLAVTPDHLDWHGSFDDYAAAKARIAARQEGDDLLVFDADDERAAAIAAEAPARRVGVSARADAV